MNDYKLNAYKFLRTFSSSDLPFPIEYGFSEKLDSIMNILESVEMIVDNGVEYWSDETHQPYYRMRGRSVSEEQALRMILKSTYCRPVENKLLCEDFTNTWLYYRQFPNSYSWVHPDGTIGLNDSLGFRPDLAKLVLDWVGFINLYPFLDLVVGVTAWDKSPPYSLNNLSENILLPDLLPVCDDFCDNLKLGIRVHNRIIEVMSPERAKNIYLQYEKKYAAPDPGKYSPYYYYELHPEIVERFEKKLIYYNRIYFKNE